MVCTSSESRALTAQAQQALRALPSDASPRRRLQLGVLALAPSRVFRRSQDFSHTPSGPSCPSCRRPIKG